MLEPWPYDAEKVAHDDNRTDFVKLSFIELPDRWDGDRGGDVELDDLLEELQPRLRTRKPSGPWASSDLSQIE